jgi:hypothetical protein
MADPRLQNQLLRAEQTYRPEYTELELADINTVLQGTENQSGLLELNRIASESAQNIAREAASAQRLADIEDVQQLGRQASDAFLSANPQLEESLLAAESLRNSETSVDKNVQDLVSQGVPEVEANQIARSKLSSGLQKVGLDQLRGTEAEAQLRQAGMDQFQTTDREMQLAKAGAEQFETTEAEAQLGKAAMGQFQEGAGEQQLNQAGLDFLSRGGDLSPTQLRNVIQQSRVASQARGRVGDQSGIANETAARLAEEMNVERQNVDIGSRLLNQGFGMGQQRVGTGANLLGQKFGMGQDRVGTGSRLLGQEFGMGQQRAGTGAQLLGQGFGMGQQRFNTAGNIYGQDLSAAQSNAAMRQQAALANQQAEMSGRGMNLESILNLGRLQQSRQQADRAYALGLVGARQSTASDPFQAILGRPAQAPGMGAASAQFAAGLAGQQLGPNLFDPNAGINLGLQNQANLANYQSSIYGSQAGFAGAQAQARGAMIGGIASGLGSIIGGKLGCWVAREVFGNENPMWVLFRQWLYEDSPKWFFNLYIKHGEKFAQFISNKPFIKRVIRKWMTSIVERKFTFNPTFI